jgi:hypothetical protein
MSAENNDVVCVLKREFDRTWKKFVDYSRVERAIKDFTDEEVYNVDITEVGFYNFSVHAVLRSGETFRATLEPVYEY